MSWLTRMKWTFGIGVCSCCDGVHTTIGNQRHGGIRWCRSCLKESFSYFKLSEPEKQALMKLWDGIDQVSAMRLEEARKAITPDDAKAIGIGESRRRLYTEER